MYELWHLGLAYGIGSAAGLILFREFVKEKIITTTIDSLAAQGYLYAEEAEDGQVMLSKVDEVVDAAVADVTVDAIIETANRMQEEIEMKQTEMWEDEDRD